jgi:RimJ/RimL family protein N-acetyltransferase
LASIETLSGRRCLLRALVPADAPSLRAHADDEAVWRTLFDGFPRPYTLADAQTWCGDSRPALFGLVWGIEVDGEIAGWLRCNAEVGYWVGQAHWRRGVASDALALVTAGAWARLPEVTRLYAPIFASNEASQAVARKCGYAKEGDLPRSAIKAGRVIDRVLYATYRPSSSLRTLPA